MEVLDYLTTVYGCTYDADAPVLTSISMLVPLMYSVTEIGETDQNFLIQCFGF